MGAGLQVIFCLFDANFGFAKFSHAWSHFGENASAFRRSEHALMLKHDKGTITFGYRLHLSKAKIVMIGVYFF